MYKNIVLIGTNSRTQKIIYNKCIKNLGIKSHYLIEKKISKSKLIKNRYNRVGFLKLADIIIFQILIQKIDKLRFTIMNRRDDTITVKDMIHLNSSVNSVKSIDLVKRIKPDLIIIAGTRILSDRFISSINCKIVNIHLGLTPKYRGVLGGIWPQLNDDRTNVGVTLHFVDTGIDTGKIISQKRVDPEGIFRIEETNQRLLCVGCDLLNKFLSSPLDNFGENYHLVKSQVLYHPGISDYFKYLWKKFLSV